MCPAYEVQLLLSEFAESFYLHSYAGAVGTVWRGHGGEGERKRKRRKTFKGACRGFRGNDALGLVETKTADLGGPRNLTPRRCIQTEKRDGRGRYLAVQPPCGRKKQRLSLLPSLSLSPSLSRYPFRC